MTHEDEGHYAKKHPPGIKLAAKMAEKIRLRAPEGKISCISAFKIAQELSVQPSEIGRAADLLEIRITKCQLGLFGYESPKRIIKPATSVDQNLEKAIQEGLVNNCLPCATIFAIAKQFGIPRMAVSSACEGLKIKISSCQLGTF